MEVINVKKDSLFDVVVVGACFCDLQTYVQRYPKPGETVFGRKFQMDFGGKGANACVMAARLGAKTSMVSLIGDDIFGRETLENFRKLEVNTDCVGVTTEASTAMTNCVVDECGEPSYISIPGASKYMTTTHVHNSNNIIKQSKVLISNNGIPLSTALEGLKLGKLSEAVTIYNPSPGIDKLPDELYKNTDVLMLNINEATAITKAKISDHSAAENMCIWFHDKGVPYVVLTMGADGAILSALPVNDNREECSQRALYYAPARQAHVIDTTGAGDALAGAFSFFVARYPHLSLKEILKRSVVIATKTVETEGVQKSYPHWETLPPELFA